MLWLSLHLHPINSFCSIGLRNYNLLPKRRESGMKSIKLLAVSVLWVLFSSSSMKALAEIKPNTFNLTPLIGGYVFEGDQDLKSGSLFGLGFGYDIGKHWGAELQLDYIDTEVDDTGESVDGYLYRLDGLYYFMPDSKLVPYLAAGVGAITLDPDRGDSDTNALFNGGGGLKYFVSESISLRGDIRYILASGSSHHNLAYTVGITFQFGGKKKATAPTALPPSDSDGDGVFDDRDQCPGTPAGAPVDTLGCPLDSDGDGVYDFKDQCPETPVGATVDGVGCPLDSDRDGIDDYKDQCPGTPTGVPVDTLGCPLDSDGDGVYDHLDKCPKTPAGAKVDEKGCPIILKQTVSIELKIEFDLNKVDIKPQYHNQLKKVADFMKEYPATTVLIEGHTDNTGSDQYNLQLSQKRADSVRQYLIDNFSIAPERLSAKGFGESRPIASNATREGREKNRRVVAVISAIKETQQMR
jgi:OOP family OmpA-OmpF porin